MPLFLIWKVSGPVVGRYNVCNRVQMALFTVEVRPNWISASVYNRVYTVAKLVSIRSESNSGRWEPPPGQWTFSGVSNWITDVLLGYFNRELSAPRTCCFNITDFQTRTRIDKAWNQAETGNATIRPLNGRHEMLHCNIFRAINHGRLKSKTTFIHLILDTIDVRSRKRTLKTFQQTSVELEIYCRLSYL